VSFRGCALYAAGKSGHSSHVSTHKKSSLHFASSVRNTTRAAILAGAMQLQLSALGASAAGAPAALRRRGAHAAPRAHGRRAGALTTRADAATPPSAPPPEHHVMGMYIYGAPCWQRHARRPLQAAWRALGAELPPSC
jgi:hypothetical protein